MKLDVVLKLGAEPLEQLVPAVYKGITGEPHFIATVTLRFSFHNKLADKTTFRVQLIQVGKLSQADDLDPGAVKVLIVTGQHDAGAVYLGGIDLELVKILGGVGNGQMGFARKLVKADEKLLHGKCAPFQF